MTTTNLMALENKPMDEDQLCQKLEKTYKHILSVKDKQLYNMYIERLSYLVLVAGAYSHGSNRLDVIFSKIQNNAPGLVAPRYVMTPSEVEKFIADMAKDDAADYAFGSYLLKVRLMTELIHRAKKEITQRSGFKFDPSVKVIRAQ